MSSKEGKVVQYFMSKKSIMNYASNKEMNRTTLMSYGILVATLILAAVGVWLKEFIVGYIGIGLFCGYLIFWRMWCENKGRKFWQSISDKDEPVKLD